MALGRRKRERQTDLWVASGELPLVNTDCPYNVKVEPRSNNAIAAGRSSFRLR